MDFPVLDGWVSMRAAPTWRPRRLLTVAVASLFLLAWTAHTTLAAVTRTYSGVIASGQKQGIRGYIIQPTSGTISGKAILSWIGLCANNCANYTYIGGGTGRQWVQLGLYQGEFAGGSSTTHVHVYYENVNPCGDYLADDVGISLQNWFRVQYNGGGQVAFNCSAGGPFLGYRFGYKKDSASYADFFQGIMSTRDGRADANTERHNGPTQSTIYFGCASSSTCLSTYGISVRSISEWGLCCSAVTKIHNDPPFLKIINNFYSFKTCQTAGACS